MSYELFPPEVVKSISPRLAWMQTKNVQTAKNKNITDPELGPFEAWIGDYGEAADKQMSLVGDLDGPFLAAANSEDDAVLALALANKWRLWNEEDLP